MNQSVYRIPVDVVLCTCNGARHIEAQWQSLQSQRWPVRIHVFDDGSDDETVSLISGMLRPGVDQLHASSDRLGHVGNFERGLRTVLDSGANYIAFADQDDVWRPDRVAVGMARMHECEQADPDLPVLVHSDLAMIDATGQPMAESYLAWRGYRLGNSPDLARVLGQNGVMGNTMLINRALGSLALPFPRFTPYHDYWLAIAAELFGRRVFIDRPLVDYRIHRDNASGKAALMADAAGAARLRRAGQGLWQRNLKLPFREDSRRAMIETLLATHDDRRRIAPAQRQLIEAFLACLGGPGSRRKLFGELWRRRFLHVDAAQSGRLALAIALTRRYPD